MRELINAGALVLIIGVMATMFHLLQIVRESMGMEIWLCICAIVIMACFFSVAGILLLCQWAKENYENKN